MKLANRIAVVTGSGSGAGEAMARRFAAEGARVVVTDVDGAAVERVAAEIGALGVAGDVTVESDVLMVIATAREELGEIDLWFSNAGYSGEPQPGVIPAEDERFLILARPHRLEELQAKGRDYEQWINDAGGRAP